MVFEFQGPSSNNIEISVPPEETDQESENLEILYQMKNSTVDDLVIFHTSIIEFYM